MVSRLTRRVQMDEQRRGDGGDPTAPSLLSSAHYRCFESYRFSFISFWCYFVLFKFLSACNSNLGALIRESVCACVCVQQLFQVSQLLSAHPPVTIHLFLLRDAEAHFLKFVSCNFQSVFFFPLVYLRQPLFNATRACTAVC